MSAVMVLTAVGLLLQGVQIVLATPGEASMAGHDQENVTLACFPPLQILTRCRIWGIIVHLWNVRKSIILGSLGLLLGFADRNQWYCEWTSKYQ